MAENKEHFARRSLGEGGENKEHLPAVALAKVGRTKNKEQGL